MKNLSRGSWTRTNECQDQNLMPYQLGDTPMSAELYQKIFRLQVLLLSFFNSFNEVLRSLTPKPPKQCIQSKNE